MLESPLDKVDPYQLFSATLMRKFGTNNTWVGGLLSRPFLAKLAVSSSHSLLF